MLKTFSLDSGRIHERYDGSGDILVYVSPDANERKHLTGTLAIDGTDPWSLPRRRLQALRQRGSSIAGSPGYELRESKRPRSPHQRRHPPQGP